MTRRRLWAPRGAPLGPPASSPAPNPTGSTTRWRQDIAHGKRTADLPLSRGEACVHGADRAREGDLQMHDLAAELRRIALTIQRREIPPDPPLVPHREILPAVGPAQQGFDLVCRFTGHQPADLVKGPSRARARLASFPNHQNAQQKNPAIFYQWTALIVGADQRKLPPVRQSSRPSATGRRRRRPGRSRLGSWDWDLWNWFPTRCRWNLPGRCQVFPPPTPDSTKLQRSTGS